jgi:hypothetical protein
VKFTNPKPGDIVNPQAYAQGKMLQHGKWNGILPRGVTPSDCDMQYFDNAGHILLVEFSRHHSSWHELSRGQRFGYENLITISRESKRHCIAALCQHDVPQDTLICTYSNVVQFSVMLCAEPAGVVTTHRPFSGDRWPEFVLSFFDDPTRTVQYVYDRIHAGN